MRVIRKYWHLIALMVVGCLVASCAWWKLESDKPELNDVSATLVSVGTQGRSLLILNLEGVDVRLGYLSFGRRCGKVREQLLNLRGQRLTVKYDVAASRPLVAGQYHRVFGIHAGKSAVCSYSDIAAMRHENDLLGIQIGLGMALASFAWMLFSSALSRPGPYDEFRRKAASVRRARELQEEEKARADLEEGENVIGDQWRLTEK